MVERTGSSEATSDFAHPTGAFYCSALHPLLKRINAYLLRWLRKKYKRLHGYKRAKRCWDGITHRDPGMFAHW
jgi:RNA-directed DNA polymerase